MMDCHEVQRIVSEKIDGEPLDAELVEAAKEHCRTCPECGAYVRVLAAIQRIPQPQPPADLVDRVMQAVAEQDVRHGASTAAEATAAAAEGTPGETVQAEAATPSPHLETAPLETAGAAPAPASEPAPATDTGVKRLFGGLMPSRQRRSVVLQIAAAATLLVVSIVVAVAGIQQITGRQAAQEAEMLSTQSEAPGVATIPAPDADNTESRDEALTEPIGSQAPPMIVVSGVVYRAIGPATDVDVDDLTAAGTTQSSLDSNGPAKVRDVLVSSDPDLGDYVFVMNDSDELLGFERVTRQYRSQTFVHSSGEILTYGVWPSVPEDVPTPSTPNGMPEYVSAGEDELGAEIFRPTAGSAADGFMIAPATPINDPAAGNPGWTWWVPAR